MASFQAIAKVHLITNKQLGEICRKKRIKNNSLGLSKLKRYNMSPASVKLAAFTVVVVSIVTKIKVAYKKLEQNHKTNKLQSYQLSKMCHKIVI